MENFYMRFGIRHPLPSTRQIRSELGQSQRDRAKHVIIVWPEPVFRTDIYGKKTSGWAH
jgi:hypothetical protein